jgi:hypothetical protein
MPKTAAIQSFSGLRKTDIVEMPKAMTNRRFNSKSEYIKNRFKWNGVCYSQLVNLPVFHTNIGNEPVFTNYKLLLKRLMAIASALFHGKKPHEINSTAH